MDNVTNFYIGDEKSICEEIRAWSAYALEKPNAYFNNMPPCPFAKRAWLDQSVAIIFRYGGSQAVRSCFAQFPEALDLIIVVDQFYKRDADSFHSELEDYNEAISQGLFGDRDLWVMGFHPDDDSNDFVDDGEFEPHINTPYAMIFIQRLSKVQEAAYTLQDLGYYDTYREEYDVEAIFEQRERLYRRLKDGNESTQKDGHGRR